MYQYILIGIMIPKSYISLNRSSSISHIALSNLKPFLKNHYEINGIYIQNDNQLHILVILFSELKTQLY